jgi:hypothetical protein|tara:strand:+ start:403 stop:852 length:450 start_codon:yes stop_codon:yes gene_type:complete
MGNIFSYCWGIKQKVKDSTLFDRLNNEDENQYSYASFIDNQNESEQKMIIDNINIIHRKIEILENTTQESLKNIHNDIRHIYEEQEVLKKSMYTQTEDLSNSEVSEDSIQNPIQENKSFVNESFVNESVQDSVYHDIQNKLPTSDEETY